MTISSNLPPRPRIVKASASIAAIPARMAPIQPAPKTTGLTEPEKS